MHDLDQTPLVSLSDILASHATFRGNRIAVVCQDERVSWSELDRRASQVANGLLASGLARGDKVALISANCTAMVEILLGINRAGLVAVPLSLLATPPAQAGMLEDAGAKAVFASDGYRDSIGPSLDGLPLVRPERRFGIGAGVLGWIPYHAWREQQSAGRPRVRLSLVDECNIIYSSGTTGTPKGIVHTQYARQQMALGLAVEFHFSTRSVALVTTPLYSNGTWMMYLPALVTSATLVIMTKFDLAGFFDLVERERVTHVFMVPPQFVAVLGHPRVATADLSSLEVMLSAGSALRADTKRQILERMGPNLMELYGLTEGVGTILRPEDVARKTESVGAPALGGDFRIIDSEGRELPRGEVGEIIGYSSSLMKGYHNRPEATAETVWRAEDGRSYLKTGDIGKLDDEGFLYLLDRKKDMILSGGFNVYPRDIEEIAARHPDVADVTVIGLPDPKWDEVPVALVIPRSGTTPDQLLLKEWINQRVGKHQRVAWVALRESFPRNALGKVLKKELRAEYGPR